jgi:hypothetical protein
MISSRHKLKVTQAVVLFIAILVMNNFVCAESSPKVLLHYEPLFQSVSVIYSNHHISTTMDFSAALPFRVSSSCKHLVLKAATTPRIAAFHFWAAKHTDAATVTLTVPICNTRTPRCLVRKADDNQSPESVTDKVCNATWAGVRMLGSHDVNLLYRFASGQSRAMFPHRYRLALLYANCRTLK